MTSFGGSNLSFVQSDISDNVAGSYAGGVLALNGLIYATQTKFNRNQWVPPPGRKASAALAASIHCLCSTAHGK